MVQVTNSYKLIETEVDGERKVLLINPKDAWSVIEFVYAGEIFKVNEGDLISFVTESGEIKKGHIKKITGKKDKTKIQLIPEGMECEEIWQVTAIKEGTFKVENSDVDLGDEE